jgi:hypothetical protein
MPGGLLSLDPVQLGRISSECADGHNRGTIARGVPSNDHNFHRVYEAGCDNGGKSAIHDE